MSVPREVKKCPFETCFKSSFLSITVMEESKTLKVIKERDGSDQRSKRSAPQKIVQKRKEKKESKLVMMGPRKTKKGPWNDHKSIDGS